MAQALPPNPNIDWLKKTAKQRLAELRAHRLLRAFPRPDRVPLGGVRDAREEQSEDQREAPHQKPSATPSPRGSAPPRIVPSRNTSACA